MLLSYARVCKYNALNKSMKKITQVLNLLLKLFELSKFTVDKSSFFQLNFQTCNVCSILAKIMIVLLPYRNLLFWFSIQPFI